MHYRQHGQIDFIGREVQPVKTCKNIRTKLC
jgi:hypothetical protein